MASGNVWPLRSSWSTTLLSCSSMSPPGKPVSGIWSADQRETGKSHVRVCSEVLEMASLSWRNYKHVPHLWGDRTKPLAQRLLGIWDLGVLSVELLEFGNIPS